MRQDMKWWCVLILRFVEMFSSVIVFARSGVNRCDIVSGHNTPWIAIVLLKCIIWDILIWSVCVTRRSPPQALQINSSQSFQVFAKMTFVLISCLWISLLLKSMIWSCLREQNPTMVSYWFIVLAGMEFTCFMIGIRHIMLSSARYNISDVHQMSADEENQLPNSTTMSMDPVLVIEVHVIQSAPPAFQCSICLIDVQPHRSECAVTTIPVCGHKFHNRCLGAWLDQEKQTCPNCRAHIDNLHVFCPVRQITDTTTIDNSVDCLL